MMSSWTVPRCSVCISEVNDTLDFYEVKLDARRYDDMELRIKVAALDLDFQKAE